MTRVTFACRRLPLARLAPRAPRPHRDGGARRRLLLGHGSGVRACERRHRRRLGLRRRVERRRQLTMRVSAERTGHAEAVRITLRSGEDQLRAAAADLFRRRPRPDPIEPPGPGQRAELPVGDLPADRRRRRRRPGLHRAAFAGQRVQDADRHANRKRARSSPPKPITRISRGKIPFIPYIVDATTSPKCVALKRQYPALFKA